MKLNNKAINNSKRILDSFSTLDRDKIHILYFKYYLNWHNIYHNPLLLGTKLLALFTGKPSIDHVCHISRFSYDRSKKLYMPKIFEATIANGMSENDLFAKLKNMQGICYIETLIGVDKKKAKRFENKYRGIAYSKNMALLSGLDLRIIDSNTTPKKDGGFCSWLVSLFLKDQGYRLVIERNDPFEITPADLYCANMGKKEILYRS